MHPQYGSKYNSQSLNSPNQSMHSGTQQVAGNVTDYYNNEKLLSWGVGVGVSNPTPHQHHHHHHGNYLHEGYANPGRNSELLGDFETGCYDNNSFHKKHTPNLIAAMAAAAAGNGRG